MCMRDDDSHWMLVVDNYEGNAKSINFALFTVMAAFVAIFVWFGMKYQLQKIIKFIGSSKISHKCINFEWFNIYYWLIDIIGRA